VATNAFGIVALAFLVDVLRRGCLWWRKCLARKVLCCLFEHPLVVMKEFFQSFCKVFLEMESIYNLLGLGSACISR